VSLRGFATVEGREPGVPAGNLRWLAGRAGLRRAQGERRGLMMPRRLVMMVGGDGMVLRAGEICRSRHIVGGFGRRRLIVFGGVGVADRLHGVAMRHPGLVSPMRVVFSRREMARRLAMTPRRLLMVVRGGCMMFGRFLVVGHDLDAP
jgi:hypothetical protein